MSKVFNKTGLIIGAGAHVPYRFPTGFELKQILRQMHPQFPKRGLQKEVIEKVEHWQSRLPVYIKEAEKLHFIEDDKDLFSERSYGDQVEARIHEFIMAFGNASVKSIDTYLSRYLGENKNDDYPKIGKFLISSILLDFEREFPWWAADDNWIHYIIDTFLVDPEQLKTFLNSPPKIITFNYDNLLENALFNHLVFFHGYTKGDAIKAIKNLDIYHVYGDLGTLLESDRLEIIKKAKNDLKVIGEDRSVLESEGKKIYNSLLGVENIYFLGFGFDGQNCSLVHQALNNKWRGGKETLYLRLLV